MCLTHIHFVIFVMERLMILWRSLSIVDLEGDIEMIGRICRLHGGARSNSMVFLVDFQKPFSRPLVLSW